MCWTGAHSVGRTHCVKLVHRLYPEVDPALNPEHIPHMLKKCPDSIPDPKAVQYVRNDRGTPMILDNNYYRNILDNKGLLSVDHQLAHDKRTKPYVKKMAKSQDYFFKEFSRAITLLSENNPLTGTKGEIRKQCSVANKQHFDEQPWMEFHILMSPDYVRYYYYYYYAKIKAFVFMGWFVRSMNWAFGGCGVHLMGIG